MKKKVLFFLIILVLLKNNIYSVSFTNVLTDDFENGTVTQNALGEYCYASVVSGNRWVGETAWAAMSGSGGMASVFSNTNSGFYYYYYTVISNSGHYLDFNDRYNNYAIMWYMRNHDNPSGPFKLDIVELDAPNYANRAEVDFKNYNIYNPGSNAVTNSSFNRFLIPIKDFTNQQAGFSWDKIKTLIFKTVTSQTSGWRMDDLMIVRGVEISEVSFSNITRSSTNHFANVNDDILISVIERSNVYGCSGYVIISNSLTHNKTVQNLKSVKIGNNGYYMTNFKPLVPGKYFIDTVLSNDIAKDTDGSLENTWDTYFYTGVGAKSIDTFVSSDTDENYFTGQSVTFVVTESNGFNDLTGYVRITNENFATNITITNYSGGEYRGNWNTSGLTATNYYCEVRLSGDTNGVNNSGVDLIVKLSNYTAVISKVSSAYNNDTDNEYEIGSIIDFTVIEQNRISGFTGKIIINSHSTGYSNEIQLLSSGNGVYTCTWDTTGVSPAVDFVIEARLDGDNNGSNNSGDDLIIKLYQSGEISFFSNNFFQKYSGEAYINIPEDALKDNSSVKLDIEAINISTGSKTLYGNIYSFKPENFIFSKSVKIGLPIPENFNNDYALYTYNGYEWIKTSSRVNILSSNYYLETDTFSTGIYAVFKDTFQKNNKINLSREVFTPNGDGVNDYINIYTPLSDSNVKITVYTLDGKEVRILGDKTTWDGRDNNNRKVKSGIYIIKVVENKNTYYKTVTVVNK